MSPARTRTREDWVTAAVAYGSEVGYDRLAVEPLAARVGATKGSFYWHFTDRAALLDAVLERWEQEATRAVSAGLDPAATDAVDRLVEAMAADPELRRAEARLLRAADHPQVGPVVERVHGARRRVLEAVARARGAGEAEAEAAARAAYALYLGTLVLGADLDDRTRAVLTSLLTPGAGSAGR